MAGGGDVDTIHLFCARMSRYRQKPAWSDWEADLVSNYRQRAPPPALIPQPPPPHRRYRSSDPLTPHRTTPATGGRPLAETATDEHDTSQRLRRRVRAQLETARHSWAIALARTAGGLPRGPTATRTDNASRSSPRQ